METPNMPNSGDDEHAVIAHSAYGPDADALFKVMEPTLRGLPFRPAHVVVRRGDSVSRIDL
ncbi:hypothetical protein ACFC00_09770 [Streptomyces adustus]|uniref:hypothetical protein n=1 Tax=Streptomyces adustus TaxID=1609272 RepID=UPI0035DC918E